MNDKQRELLERAHKMLGYFDKHPFASEQEVYEFTKSIGIEDPLPAPVGTLVVVAKRFIREALEFNEPLKLNVSKRIQKGVKPVSRNWDIISLPNDGKRHLKADDGSTLCGVEINEFESWALSDGENCDRCNLVLEYLVANGYRHDQ